MTIFKLFSGTKQKIQVETPPDPNLIVKDARVFELTEKEEAELMERCKEVAVDSDWLQRNSAVPFDGNPRGRVISNVWTSDELADLERRRGKRQKTIGQKQKMKDFKQKLKDRLKEREICHVLASAEPLES